jgi:hypothetical protein
MQPFELWTLGKAALVDDESKKKYEIRSAVDSKVGRSNNDLDLGAHSLALDTS